MNIYQRVNAVRKEVAYVQKDAVVQGYRAVTHDQVTAQVRDQLVKHGIVVVPNFQDGNMVDAGKTSNGKDVYRYEATYRVDFINEEDPSDRIEVVMQAHANDMSDKAPGKACSYAVKYAMLKLFSLETGENEESRVEADRRADVLTERLVGEVRDYLEHGDTVAVYLLSQQVGTDNWAAVYNAGTEGKKTEWKKQLKEAEAQGFEVVTEINRAILTEDAGAACENTDDMTDAGKRLLRDRLGPEKTNVLAQLIKSVKGDTA